jgi:hypothetical protein
MRWPWVSRKLLDLTERELTYYRDRYEREKDRADRAVDSLVQWCGREPISAPSREVVSAQRNAYDEMQKQVNEIFAEVMDSANGEDISEQGNDSTVENK